MGRNDGKPVEILRTLILGPIHIGFLGETNVRFHHCVAPGSNHKLSHVVKHKIRWKMENCAFYGKDVGIHASIFSFVQNGGTKLPNATFVAKRCLFQSNDCFLSEGVPKWSGEQNYYQFPDAWLTTSGSVYCLSQWRALSESWEKGSKEGMPAIYDPETWRLHGSEFEGAGSNIDQLLRPKPSDTVSR